MTPPLASPGNHHHPRNSIVPGPAYEKFLEALESAGQRVNRSGPVSASAQCPAHGDNRNSLGVWSNPGKVGLKCFAGCEGEDILKALELTWSDVYDNGYGVEYHYEDGRTVNRFGAKKFNQVNGKGNSVLYRLSEVKKAVADGLEIYLVEGEEDVHSLERIGEVATTAPGGVGNIAKADLSPLKDAVVHAIVDKDDAGKKWADTVAEKLEGVASLVYFEQAKTGKDVSDHLAAGHTLADLIEIEAPEPAGRRLKVTRASDIKMKATRWLWEEPNAQWLPLGGLTLLGGREGIGKSTIAYWIAAQMTLGKLPGCYQGQPRSVVISANEDAWEQTVVPRLAASGANLERVLRVDAVTEEGWYEGLSLPEDVSRITRVCEKESVGLLLLDPLMSTLNVKLDSHKDAEVRRALEPLSRLAADAQLSIIGLIHVNKTAGTDLLDRLMGSKAFAAVARAVLFAQRDESGDGDDTEERFIFGQAKSNLGRKVPHCLEYRIDGVTVGHDGILGEAIRSSRVMWTGKKDGQIQEHANQQQAGRDTPRGRAAEFIVKYLTDRGGSCPAAEVKQAAADTNSGSAVDRAARELQRLGQMRSEPLPGGMKNQRLWSLSGSDVTDVTDVFDVTDVTDVTGQLRQKRQLRQTSGDVKGDVTSDVTGVSAPSAVKSLTESEIDQWLRDQLANSPVQEFSLRLAAERAGISSDPLSAAFQRMGACVGAAPTYFVSLPEGPDQTS